MATYATYGYRTPRSIRARLANAGEAFTQAAHWRRVYPTTEAIVVVLEHGAGYRIHALQGPALPCTCFHCTRGV